LGALANYKKGLDEVVLLWDEALDIARDLDREYIWIHANLLEEIATKELNFSNINAACQYAEAALRLFGPEGCTDRWSSAYAYDRLAYCAFSQGKNSESRVYRMKALALHQESGDNVGFANASCGLAMYLIILGEFGEAVYHNDNALRTWHFVGNERFASCHIAFLGVILANIGCRLEDQKGKECFFQAVAFLSIADMQYPPDDEMKGYYGAVNRSEAEQILRSHLSADDYAAAWAEGQSMTLEEGIALASRIAEEWNIQA
jgi:tetratricopeptide (TPR) repeat protein